MYGAFGLAPAQRCLGPVFLECMVSSTIETYRLLHLNLDILLLEYEIFPLVLNIYFCKSLSYCSELVCNLNTLMSILLLILP